MQRLACDLNAFSRHFKPLTVLFPFMFEKELAHLENRWACAAVQLKDPEWEPQWDCPPRYNKEGRRMARTLHERLPGSAL